MFRFLLPFLFSSLIFAQNIPTADSVLLNSGRYVLCFISRLDKENIEILMPDSKTFQSGYINVRSIKVAGLNFTIVPSKREQSLFDSAAGFINARYEKMKAAQAAAQKAAQIEAEKRAFESKPLVKINSANELADAGFTQEQICHSSRLWSFGFAWMPYSTYTDYLFSISNNEISLSSASSIRSWIDCEFTYQLKSNIRLTFNLDASSTKSENNESSNGGYQYEYPSTGENQINTKLTVFDLNLGLKYYLGVPEAAGSTAYIFAGIGKQFAFCTTDMIGLLPKSLDGRYGDLNDFIRDSNSPFHCNLGFGAEYRFNESLSMFARMRFVYMNYSAKLSKLTEDSYEYETDYSKSVSKSSLEKDIALGMNFYF